MTKQSWLDGAQIVDVWRVVPRTVLFSYLIWVAHVTNSSLAWIMALPAADRTVTAASMVGGIITVVTGLFPLIYRIYSDNSNDWSSQQPSRVSTVSTMTEVTK